VCRTVKQLISLLRAHMTLEEEVVYPAMKRVTGDDSEVENRNEHGRRSLCANTSTKRKSFLDGEPGRPRRRESAALRAAVYAPRRRGGGRRSPHPQAR
jgi:hypothetical protein